MAHVFHNYKKQVVSLNDGTLEHIEDTHAEISIKEIKIALEDPDEVRTSSYKDNSELYYLLKTKKRYVCVVVKICKDGNFISTAMTTTKPKVGQVIYKKGV